MNEIREIPDYPLYGVSADGRAWSRKRSKEWRELKPSLHSMGYLKIKLGRTQTATVHHLVALVFIGPRPHGMDINHIDGNKLNAAAKNLEYCTRSHNLRHAYRTGLRISKAGCTMHSSKQVLLPQQLTGPLERSAACG